MLCWRRLFPFRTVCCAISGFVVIIYHICRVFTGKETGRCYLLQFHWRFASNLNEVCRNVFIAWHHSDNWVLKKLFLSIFNILNVRYCQERKLEVLSHFSTNLRKSRAAPRKNANKTLHSGKRNRKRWKVVVSTKFRYFCRICGLFELLLITKFDNKVAKKNWPKVKYRIFVANRQKLLKL